VDRVGERLLAVDVLAAVQGPYVDEGVRVVGRGADDGVDVFLVEALAPVDVGLGLRVGLGGLLEVVGVNIAQGDDVLARDLVQVAPAAPAHADAGDVELLAGRLARLKHARPEHHQPRARQSHLEQLTTLHRGSP
jgi:hypothetical protein